MKPGDLVGVRRQVVVFDGLTAFFCGTHSSVDYTVVTDNTDSAVVFVVGVVDGHQCQAVYVVILNSGVTYHGWVLASSLKPMSCGAPPWA